ncbi:Serine palmitoyltransferase 2 [Balamuthia mandrillaris]
MTVQQKKPHTRRPRKATPDDDIPWITAILTYLAYAIYILLGHIHDFISKHILRKHFAPAEKGYAPLLFPQEYFYARRLFGRIKDCWDRPICSDPGAVITVMERTAKRSRWDFSLDQTGTTIRSLNLGSYNYLGFAETSGKCLEEVVEATHKYGISCCSAREEVGTMDLHRELDKRVAEFVGKEDAITFAMGYGTNATTIPALIGKGGLIISDALNHASIVVGCRASGAKIKTFKHNDTEDLERVLRQSIAEGQPRTHRHWKKILIIVEGIYSMEGEILALPEIVALKKKYKAYLYVDEAHSIGALGKSARGVCDYWGVDPKDVDILMGTFTKSFGSIGGYIAGDRDLIEYLRQTSLASVYDTAMSPGCVRMILSAFDVITGADGTDDGQKRVQALADNSIYFRNRLKEMGFRVIGDGASPVIPLMLYHPSKIAAFSRECLHAGIAVVVVGFPATSLLASRARFCMSAAHDRETLDKALAAIDEIGNRLMLKYGEL